MLSTRTGLGAASNVIHRNLLRSSLAVSSLHPRPAFTIPQQRAASSSVIDQPIVPQKPKRKVKWIEQYKKMIPDTKWIDDLDPINRKRSECKDSFVAWISPEASVFVICVVFTIGMGFVFLFLKTFVYDPEVASEIVNHGWFPNAYRGVDPTNGFRRPQDIKVPFRFPRLAPLNSAWFYSKSYMQAEAAAKRWNDAREKWWREIERPRLMAQIEEMEQDLKRQQELGVDSPSDEIEYESSMEI